MDGPVTVIDVSAVARNSGLILLWGPLKITFSGGGRASYRNILSPQLLHFLNVVKNVP